MTTTKTIPSLFVILVGCGSAQPAAETPASLPPAESVLTEPLDEDALPDFLYLNIQVRGFGYIKVELFGWDAPANVTNVANLAIDGYYDGLTFHRILAGKLIQGGDPEGTGKGGPGYTVPAEIQHTHEKGCMAMARKADEVNPEKESSGSQFYLCLTDLPGLDGEYTVIGRIVEGLDVAEAIGEVLTDDRDFPLEDVVMESVTVTTE